MGEIGVRLAVSSDCEQLSRLREALWPDASAAEHRKEIASILVGEYNGTMPMAIFVAETSSIVLAGFLEVGLRSHADGCDPRHAVGFVEGGSSRKSIAGRGHGPPTETGVPRR